VVSLTVSDARGRYVKGLEPADFKVYEDGVEQQIQTFSREGHADTAEATRGDRVYVLFDTSNAMYGRLPYLEDCMASFARSLDPSIEIGVYSFTRNVSRLALPTLDRYKAIGGIRQATLGDDTAMFDAILVTLRDAAALPGRSTIVVFSNGPDTASMLAPDDVAQVAEDAGIPVYVISTHMDDSRTQQLCDRISMLTGGRTYDAASLVAQQHAFRSIRDDLSNTYMLAYTPPQHSGFGFHKIEVKIPSAPGAQIRTRAGYTTPPDTE
jgi:Ca-activated chloride channel homolog